MESERNLNYVLGQDFSVITLLGADFKRQFDLDTYKKFFEEKGYRDVEYHVVDGRMPCAIALITKE